MIDQTLAEKYRPKHLSEIIGHDNAVIELQGWTRTWSEGKPDYKSAFLYGPPGVGKTSAAIAAACDAGWEIAEFNAGEACSREAKTAVAIKDLIGGYIYTRPHENICLILIDEADVLGKKSFEVLETLIEKSVNPIVLTCNDEYAIKKITPYYRNNSLMIRFSPLKPLRIRVRVMEIMKAEGIVQPFLDKLIDNSEGDLRYVLNNLETLSVVPRSPEQNIFSIVHDIFRREWDGNLEGAKPDQIWFAVRQNIQNFYDDVEGIPVLEWMSMMDMQFARLWSLARKGDGKQAYRMWRTIISLFKSLPMHQKTAKIELHSLGIDRKKDPERQLFARDMHVSYRKASSPLEFTPEIYELWKQGVGTNIVKATKRTKSVKPLFHDATPVPAKKAAQQSLF